MWAHPYLQAVNLVHATKQDPHAWTHDGDMAETFGLEPNFGCCVRNLLALLCFLPSLPSLLHLTARLWIAT